MGESGDETSQDDTPYDYVKAAETMIDWVDHWGISAIPSRMLPPIDRRDLARARQEAEQVARQVGRLDELAEYRRQIVERAFGHFRTYAYYAGTFVGHSAPAETKVEGVEVLLDTLTGYMLADVLHDDVTTTLLTRLDVIHGGPLFRVDAEPD